MQEKFFQYPPHSDERTFGHVEERENRNKDALLHRDAELCYIQRFTITVSLAARFLLVMGTSYTLIARGNFLECKVIW